MYLGAGWRSGRGGVGTRPACVPAGPVHRLWPFASCAPGASAGPLQVLGLALPGHDPGLGGRPLAAPGRYQAGAPLWRRGGGCPPGGASAYRWRASPADALVAAPVNVPLPGVVGPPSPWGASRRGAAPCGPFSSAVSAYGGKWILKQRWRCDPGGCRRWCRSSPPPAPPPGLPGPYPYCRSYPGSAAAGSALSHI